MSETGVFGVARSIWEHPCLEDEGLPFSKREAWLWLISSAAYKSRRVGTAGRVIPIERGEFCYAIRFLERKWRWKPGRVERFLKMLENHDMIRDTGRDRIKVYSILNYNEYQVVALPKRDTQRDDDATPARLKRDKEEEGKKESTPLAKANGRPAAPVDPWKPVYDRGKQILGREAGGVITKLRKLYDEQPRKVLAKLEDAGEQRNPLPWIMAFLHKVDDGGKLAGEYIGGIPP